MSTVSSSPRVQLAERIAEFVRQHRLDRPYGGLVVKQGRYYSVGISLPRVLGGTVNVYGPSFIQVALTGQAVNGSRSAVFASESDALEFLRLLLVERDEAAADAVPVKPER